MKLILLKKVQAILPVFALAALFSAAAQAATIRVDGVIEGSSMRAGFGETMDYLKFEVLTTSTVLITGLDIGGRRLDLASFIGRTDTFGFIDNPYQLVGNYPSPTPPVLERILEAGIYVVVVDDEEDSQYDWGDGFVAVNRDGGSFSSSPYSFEVSGDVRGLELWEGQFDPEPYGAFKVTTLPEPSSAVLAGLVAAVFTYRRKKG